MKVPKVFKFAHVLFVIGVLGFTVFMGYQTLAAVSSLKQFQESHLKTLGVPEE